MPTPAVLDDTRIVATLALTLVCAAFPGFSSDEKLRCFFSQGVSKLANRHFSIGRWLFFLYRAFMAAPVCVTRKAYRSSSLFMPASQARTPADVAGPDQRFFKLWWISRRPYLCCPLAKFKLSVAAAVAFVTKGS